MSWQYIKDNLHAIAESLHIAKQKRSHSAQSQATSGNWLGWDGWVCLPAEDGSTNREK